MNIPSTLCALSVATSLALVATASWASPSTRPVQSAMQSKRDKINAATREICEQTGGARSLPGALAQADKLATSPTAKASDLIHANDAVQTAAMYLAAQGIALPANLSASALQQTDAALAKPAVDAPTVAAAATTVHGRVQDATRLLPPIGLTSAPLAADAATVGGLDVCSSANSGCSSALDTLCGPAGQLESGAGGSPGAGSPLGAGWQTAVVTGLAQYLQQRAADEVVLWFEDELMSRLCTQTYTIGAKTLHGKDVFAQTCALTGDSSTNLSTLFASALRADLEALPLQLATRLLDVNVDIASDLVDRFRSLRLGQPPLEVLAGMGDPTSAEAKVCASTSTDKLACALSAVGIAVRWSGDAQQSIIQLERALAGLSAQVDIVGTFVESVNAECKSLGTACTLKVLDAAGDRMAIATFLRKVQAVYALVAGAGGSGDAAARGGQLIVAAVGVIDALEPMLKDTTKAAFDPTWAQVKPALDAVAELLEGKTADGTRDALAAVRSILDSQKATVPAAVTTTVSLAADLASAQTPQDVQSALQTAAAPLGSWKDKHKHFSVTLNAYVGGTGGYEAPLQGVSKDLRDGAAGGAFAAVGVDLSGPYSKDCNWNWGLLVSALDVGQLLTSPIAPSNGQQNGNAPGKTAEPGGDINVVQVLSPGLYLHTSLGNSPFTLGGGVALAPLLRSYAEDNGTRTPYSMLRVGAFIGVDLDLIPFYTAHDSEN